MDSSQRTSGMSSHLPPHETPQHAGPNDTKGDMTKIYRQALAAFYQSRAPFRLVSSSLRPDAVAPARDGYQRLVVLDSSFNPPTRAHAEMLLSALRASEGLKTRVLLLLAVKNADKPADEPASFPVRLGMMDSFGSSPGLRDDGVPVDVGVTTRPYFHDKSSAIADSGAFELEQQQVFLAGFDTLIRIFDPKYYTETGKDGETSMQAALGPFFQRAALRITLRPDDKWGGVEEQRDWVRQLREGKLNEMGGKVEWMDKVELVDGVKGEAVSSSKARKMVSEGKIDGIEDLVGAEVQEWIADQNLYRDDGKQ